MQIEREWLNGSPISQSPELGRVGPADVFLVSEPFVDKGDCKQFFSKKLDYATLSGHLLDDILGTIRLNSMSWELSGDYARWDHRHNYSNVSVKSLVDKSDVNPKLADIVIDGENVTISMPEPRVPVQDKPQIGQLKFMTRLAQKDMDGDDFDGWVYPDGRYLDKDRFDDAFGVFGFKYGQDGETRFAIPRLNHFIKSNPCIRTSDLELSVEFNNGVGQHAHGVRRMNSSQDISAEMRIYVTKVALKGMCAHGGNGKSDIIGNVTSNIRFWVDNMSIPSADIEQYGSVIESYPRYNMLPVLMYVGGEGK